LDSRKKLQHWLLGYRQRIAASALAPSMISLAAAQPI